MIDQQVPAPALIALFMRVLGLSISSLLCSPHPPMSMCVVPPRLTPQPHYNEAVAVIQYDRDCKAADLPTTRQMITRFPLTVYCADKAGFSLFHHAVVREVCWRSPTVIIPS